MDFVGGLPTTRKGHDYLFVVVDRFNKMCILMPCKKAIKGHEAKNMFFEQGLLHFGIPRIIILNRIPNFSMCFRLKCGMRWTLS
jgi:hypothetical protein